MRSERLEILEDEEAVYSLVRTQREAIEQLGVTPKLHLRGDKETVFRHSRTVIRAAARAGVDQVVFAVFLKDPGY
jgi:biopolymer transport protein ExbD